MTKVQIITLSGVLMFASCVPLAKFKDMQSQNTACQKERDSLKQVLSSTEIQNTEYKGENETMKGNINRLVADSTSLSEYNRRLTEQNEKLNVINDQLVKSRDELMQDNDRESQRLMNELQKAKSDVQRREDKLDSLQKNLAAQRAQLEKEIAAEKANLQKIKSEMGLKDDEILKKNQRLTELEQVLHSKDSIANALKNKISLALKGFEGNGLSVVQREGKIYVSLDEQLLFEIGKAEVSVKGTEALKKIAYVLEKNTDINILVEGHTDATGSPRLNWELSTKRALSITQIIQNAAKIDGKRLTAAGRGQYSPLDAGTTKEAYQKNRRCEIILSPKLDELFNIINN